MRGVAADSTSYSDTGLAPGTTYHYYVSAYNSAGYSDSNEMIGATGGNSTPVQPTVPATPSAPSSSSSSSQTALRFHINNSQYYINDIPTPMDASPVIKDGRTLLPVRYVAIPLGATVDWDAVSKKVTVSNNGIVIELWINRNTARVNGVDRLIDPDNSSVTPVILPPGRTMLPLRFIAENLGCQVEWNGSTKEAKVTYPKS